MERVRLVDWLKSERDQLLVEACTTTHRFYLPTIPITWKAPLFHQNKPRSCSTRVPCSPTTSTMKSEQTMSPKQRTTSMRSIGP